MNINFKKDFKIEYLREAYKHIFDNKLEILQSHHCGCTNCFMIFLPSDIKEWSYCNSTICPNCSLQTVIGSATGFPVTNIDFLKRINENFFKILEIEDETGLF